MYKKKKEKIFEILKSVFQSIAVLIMILNSDFFTLEFRKENQIFSHLINIEPCEKEDNLVKFFDLLKHFDKIELSNFEEEKKQEIVKIKNLFKEFKSNENEDSSKFFWEHYKNQFNQFKNELIKTFHQKMKEKEFFQKSSILEEFLRSPVYFTFFKPIDLLRKIINFGFFFEIFLKTFLLVSFIKLITWENLSESLKENLDKRKEFIKMILNSFFKIYLERRFFLSENDYLNVNNLFYSEISRFTWFFSFIVFSWGLHLLQIYFFKKKELGRKMTSKLINISLLVVFMKSRKWCWPNNSLSSLIITIFWFFSEYLLELILSNNFFSNNINN